MMAQLWAAPATTLVGPSAVTQTPLSQLPAPGQGTAASQAPDQSQRCTAPAPTQTEAPGAQAAHWALTHVGVGSAQDIAGCQSPLPSQRWICDSTQRRVDSWHWSKMGAKQLGPVVHSAFEQVMPRAQTPPTSHAETQSINCGR
jgi:hypothetical protein